MVDTGERTGRSPNDKFLVRCAPSEELVDWGKINVAVERSQFDQLRQDMLTYLEGKDVYVRDCYAGADPQFRMPIRVIT